VSHRAYVGIGTNLGDRFANVGRALDALRKLGRVRRSSSLYRTEPWGKRDQPWFLNAVVLLETDLRPRALLEELQVAEKKLGRRSGERWGARVIDLDLLLYDDVEIDEPDFRVPHPRLRERAFVLVPLAQLDERFAPLRELLPARELAGVVPVERESGANMPEERWNSIGERVRALAALLVSSDAIRVRVQRGDVDVEVGRRSRRQRPLSRSSGAGPAESPAQRIDTIKADLVGIFHVGRPAPAEGDLFDGDRELGYVEALGIRTPVRSMGGGRLVAIATSDGSPVEYGQPLFLVARTR
jgi:2-amino-4-hydroxy-6-hydroxymethyldihydropteridine diphosphokinase